MNNQQSAPIFLRRYIEFLTNQEEGVKHHVTQPKSWISESFERVCMCEPLENVADQMAFTKADSNGSEPLVD